MTVLAIDLGQARVGIAVSDPDEIIGQPLEVLRRSTDDALLSAIGRLAALHNADQIVVGYPLRLDGTEGNDAQAAREFAERITQTTRIPAALVDERFTSVIAAQSQRGHRSASARRAAIDKVAAALILQTYLDRRRYGADGTK